MKAVKRDLQSVIKSLKVLTEKAEKIAGQLDAMAEVKTAQKEPARAKKSTAKKGAKGTKADKAKAPKGAKGSTATETVLGIIKRQKKGIDTAGLKEKTDFDTKTIRNVIFRLKKQGKVETTSRGIYMAA
jgi:hypothetical protein